MASFIFSSPNADGTIHLYATDGTAAGTNDLQIARFGSLTIGQQPDFVDLGSDVLFVGTALTIGGVLPTLYRTDGTAVGTSDILIAGDGGSLSPTGLWSVGNTVLTSGNTTLGAPGVFASTDGVSFSEIATGVAAGFGGILVSNGVGYFGGVDGAGNSQGLWRTDGTAAGTYSITPPGVTLDPAGFTPVGAKTLFTSLNPGGSNSLWITDGTAAGTTQLAVPGLANQYAEGSFFSLGSKVLFLAISAPDAASYPTLWVTDGTDAGTTQISVGSFSDEPTGVFAALGSQAVFSTATNLYITDGASLTEVPSPTTSIVSFVTLGNDIIYIGVGTSSSAAGANSLFSYDSSTGVTTQIALPSVNIDQSKLGVINDQVIFAAVDPLGAEAFYTTDGTQADTKALSLSAGVTPDAANQSFIAGLPGTPTGGGGTPPVTIGGGDQNIVASAGMTYLAGSGDDTITAAAGYVTVVASSGLLAFIGGAGPSSVAGSTGSSTIFGGAGGGTYVGGRNGFNVLVSEGASGANTTLTGAGGGDQIFGSASGNDELIAGSGRDSILGGGGHTTIQGGSTASVIFTGAASSLVFGGSGGGDTIVGGTGSLDVNAQGGDAIFGGSGALEVTASKSGADSIVGGAGALDVNGQGANMLVVAGTSTSDIQVGNGASLIFAGSGSTSVTAGSGSLQVVLGSGAATINEGSGPALYDVVDGAAGGNIVLNGFKPGTDKIELFGYTASQQQITTSSGSSILTLADGTKILVAGVSNLGNSIIG